MRKNLKAEQNHIVDYLDHGLYFPKLSDYSLYFVLQSIRQGKISFESLPSNIHSTLIDFVKSFNLLSYECFELFFKEKTQNFILSGFNAYIDSKILSAVDIKKVLGSQIHTVGLYNCGNLSSSDIEKIIENIPECKNLNLGRLRSLTDNHCLKIHKYCTALESIILNRNPQLTSKAICELHNISSLTEMSLFTCTGMKNAAEFIAKIKSLQVIQLVKLPMNSESWKMICKGCTNLRFITAQSQKLNSGMFKEICSSFPQLIHFDFIPGGECNFERN